VLRFVVTLSLVPIALTAAAAGCSSDDDPSAAPDNGVDDVRQACEIRLSWQGSTSSRCSYCLAAAANPPCACTEAKVFAGKCETQQTVRSKESSCAGVEECRFACSPSDCGCLDACYAQKDACRSATAALDGCVAKACAEECAAP
jgi:hypothetical protein